MILYIFFHDLIHVYSPGAGAYSPQGTKFWCQQKLLVTSVICCQFQIIDDNSFWKIHCFTFFPYKSIRDQIWPCRKIGQGQPRVIIWANLVVLKHPMMHTKIQGQWPFGSGEEDFFRFLPYMAMVAILVMDQDHLSKLSFPHHTEAPYEIWLWLAQWFLRRRCLKSVDDDGRRRPTYPISAGIAQSVEALYFTTELHTSSIWVWVQPGTKYLYGKKYLSECMWFGCRLPVAVVSQAYPGNAE